MQDSPVEQTFRDTERKLREKIKRYEEVMEKAQAALLWEDAENANKQVYDLLWDALNGNS